MPGTGRICGVAATLVLWSSQCLSMMGGEGPPPCETEACFVEAVSACEKGKSYIPAAAAGTMVQYVVEEQAKDGRCQIAMIYMRHPDSGWTYKPLHFVLDTDQDIESRLRQGVAECLEGTADSTFQCSGPLLELTDTAAH